MVSRNVARLASAVSASVWAKRCPRENAHRRRRFSTTSHGRCIGMSRFVLRCSSCRGGSMQSSATRFWHLKHLVQDCPGNCAHEEQFDTNSLRQMASLIITLSRRSSNVLQRHTLATTLLASLNCKAVAELSQPLHSEQWQSAMTRLLLSKLATK